MSAPQLRRRTDNPVYAFLDAAPNAVVVVTGEGLIDYINPVACDAFGYQFEELVDQPVERLVPDDLVTRHVDLRAEFFAHPLSRPIGTGRELNARRKDGSLFPAEISLSSVQWRGHDMVVASIIDVTSRLQDRDNLNELIRLYLTLAQMNQAVVRAPDATSLFSQTCTIAVEQGGYQGAWVGQRGEGHTVQSIASAGVLDDYIAQQDASTDPEDDRGNGPIGRVMRDGVSYYAEHFTRDEATKPWRSLGAGFGIKSTATLPLRCAGRVVATLTLYSGRAGVFTGEVRTLLEGMADNVSVALDGFDGVAKLYDVALQRTELARRLVAAQEAERSRIAADVHDDSVQTLAALDLRLGLLKRQVIGTDPEVGETLEELRATVGLVSAGLRDLLFELEPPGPDSHLLAMLQGAASHVFAATDIECSVTADFAQCPHNRALSPTDRGQALRIVKEAMFNARKYSGASRVSVTVTPKPHRVEVEVTDDGRGFDASQRAAAPGHRGLANMHDRAVVSGGRCRVTSGEGGTTVRFWMPYDEAASTGKCFSEEALRDIEDYSSGTPHHT
jgi:PAS domain S-box-containing protein